MIKSACRFPASSFLSLLLSQTVFLSSTVSGQCTFCQDGSATPNPEFVIKDFNLPCGILEARAKSIAIDDTNPDICAEYTMLGLMCGCPAPENACTLCEDSNEIPDKGLNVGKYVCRELDWEGNLQSSEDWSLCPAWRASFGVYCGCENPISSEGYCRVCGDQLLPDPSFVVGVNDLGFEITCADIEFNENNRPCDEIQSTYSMACCSLTSLENTVTPSTNENTIVLGLNETSDDIDDESADTTTALGSNETSDGAGDASVDNTNANENSDAVDDPSNENTTVPVSDDIADGTEDGSVDEMPVVDSKETLDDVEDTSLAPHGDIEATDNINGVPDSTTKEIASSTLVACVHPYLIYATVCGVLFMMPVS